MSKKSKKKNNRNVAQQRMTEELKSSPQAEKLAQQYDVKPSAEKAEDNKAETAGLPQKENKAERAGLPQEENREQSEVKTYRPEKKSRKPKLENNEFSQGFNEALSENYEEITETGEAEETEQPTEEAASEEAPRPNKFYLVFAVFVIIMSVIGVVSTVNFCKDKINDIVNQTDLKNEIALFLYPLVSVDPPDCASVDELPSSIVVESAIWRIILTGSNDNYEKLYNSYMYVPAVDVEYSIRSIFGGSVEIQHQTVGGADTMFTYVTDSNSYLVPINPRYTAYSPRITQVSNVGELYTVTVDYIPPSALAIEGIEFENKPTKTMVYTLSKSKNVTTLHSIKNATSINGAYEY
ncbi:MAG: hypothetical protein ACI4KR_02585 [Ruminiclostridium sp.]